MRNLTYETLIQIATELNHNAKLNSIREQNEIIPPAIYIKKFGISTSEFKKTIELTDIKYNNTLKKYVIDDGEIYVKQLYDSEQISLMPLKQQTQELVIPQEINNLTNIYPEIEEMLQWYKNNHSSNVINIIEHKIDLSDPRLGGEVIQRSVKTYKNVMDNFSKYCTERKEKQMDLIAIAILEFMDKYK